MKKLYELVSMRSGYSFRAALSSYEQGSTEVIQAKDLGDDFEVSPRPKIAFQGGKKHLLQDGDILVSARGVSRAVVYRGHANRAVASSSVFVLTPVAVTADSDAIALYLNSRVGVKELVRLSSGASLQMITKENLGALEVPEIPVEHMKLLSEAIDTIDRYRKLLLDKQEQLERLRASIISKTIQENTK